MYSDLLPYGIDLRETVRGQGPAPLFVLSVIARLPLGSAYISMRLAEDRGGSWQDYLGKDHHWFLMADLYDATMMNTVATGNYKKRPKVEPYPRPGKSKSDIPDDQKMSVLHGMFGGAGQF